MGPRVLTLREVASYFHVHPETVYRLVKPRHLSACPVSHDFRFEIKVLEDVIVNRGTGNLDSDEQK